jgi:CheY-like chemotaxis protein
MPFRRASQGSAGSSQPLMPRRTASSRSRHGFEPFSTKILYVKDNEDNISMLKRRLERAGFEVVVAPDGEQGLAVARAAPPDLILMDLSLPVLDGWEATRRLKSDAAHSGHRPVRPRHVRRSREGARGRLRRLRCQAGQAGQSPGQNTCAVARGVCALSRPDDREDGSFAIAWTLDGDRVNSIEIEASPRCVAGPRLNVP